MGVRGAGFWATCGGREDEDFVSGPLAVECVVSGGSFKSGKGGILEKLGYRKDQVHHF